MSKTKRFFVGLRGVAYERTGNYERPEPVGVFEKRKYAVLFCKMMNDLWEKEQQKASSPKCGNHQHVPLGFVRLNCEYDEKGVCIHCGEEIPF